MQNNTNYCITLTHIYVIGVKAREIFIRNVSEFDKTWKIRTCFHEHVQIMYQYKCVTSVVSSFHGIVVNHVLFPPHFKPMLCLSCIHTTDPGSPTTAHKAMQIFCTIAIIVQYMLGCIIITHAYGYLMCFKEFKS